MAVCCHIIGEGPVRLWGLSSRERYRRMLKQAGATAIADDVSYAGPGDSVLLIRGDYLIDGRLLHRLAGSVNVMLVAPAGPASVVVAAHVPAHLAPRAREILSRESATDTLPGVRVESVGDRLSSFDESLRKTEPPIVEPIRPETQRGLERRLFSSSYKGVTDLVTKWLWPLPARWATRLCAAVGVRPNHITMMSLALVFVAGALFANGVYGWGLVAAWIMTFLDTVDGKLARVTVTSTRLGHFLDKILDLTHPPFWYLLWGLGLESFQPGVSSLTLSITIRAIFIGYIAGRLVEGAFQHWLGAFGIFCWRPVDSYFRLITARRNPNLILLTASLTFNRPDLGLVGVAAWTVLSSLVLLGRLGFALLVRLKYGPLRSWLVELNERSADDSLAVRLFAHQSPVR
jgi:phosphatidylglycerophosphate synthase